jgi:hypothetical protein
LRVVADHGHALPVGRESAEDVGLQRVGVLVFVDEHRVEAGANRGCRLRRRHQGLPEEEQIVVVEDRLGLFAIDVDGKELLERVDMLAAPGKDLGDDFRQRFPAIDAAAVNVEARPLEWEPRRGLGQILLGADGLHQIFRVAAVEDRELL